MVLFSFWKVLRKEKKKILRKMIFSYCLMKKNKNKKIKISKKLVYFQIFNLYIEKLK